MLKFVPSGQYIREIAKFAIGGVLINAKNING